MSLSRMGIDQCVSFHGGGCDLLFFGMQEHLKVYPYHFYKIAIFLPFFTFS